MLAISSRCAKPRRVLGYVLLVLIAYGATVEVAHSHGRAALNRPEVTAISDAGGSQSSDNGHSRDRECSMCQFQQQLFGGLVHAPLFSRSPLAEIAFVSTLTVSYPSTSTPPPSGRGPPLVKP
jgi:hypothetical protein